MSGSLPLALARRAAQGHVSIVGEEGGHVPLADDPGGRVSLPPEKES